VGAPPIAACNGVVIFVIVLLIICRRVRKLQKKATISFVMSVRPSTWNNSGPNGRIYMKLDIWIFFENLLGKIMLHYNLTTITVLYMQTDIRFWTYLAQFFLGWEMFQTKRKDKIKTIMYFIFNYFSQKFDEIKWKNVAEPDRRQITIWRMFITSWIHKAANTNSEYIIFIAFPLQQWFQMVSLDFFHWHNPSGRTMALGWTQPLTEMSTRNVSWG